MQQNKRLTEKLADVLVKLKNPKPSKTGDEVVEDILKKHGITFGKGGE